MAEIKKTSFNIPIETKNKLKIIAIQENKTLTELVIEILNDGIAKREK